jgi:hypothetical protein
VRLDHLLSKEHTPRCQANVLARMVVFTSGIVDGQLCWLLMALRWWGMGSGTLLGPEGSAVCWLVVLVLPLLEAVLCGWLRVLVGLLFEICIVDASIFVAS